MCALLTSAMGNNVKVAFYINACRKMGIEVLPPDINESFVDFSVVGNKIRFGLAAIKNVGKNVVLSIINTRKRKGAFKRFTEFCEKANFSEINKRAVESMIKAGAFDSLKLKRAQLLNVYDKVIDSVVNEKKRNIEGQVSLFAMNNDIDRGKADDFPDIKEFDKKYILVMEKEMLGLYISGHPLDEYEEELDLMTNTKLSELIKEEDEENGSGVKLEDGQQVIVGGIVSGINIKSTRNNDIMAFVTCEDMFNSVEVIVFPKVYQRCSKHIIEDAVVVIKGRISIKEDEQPKIIADNIEPLHKTVVEFKKLYVRLDDSSWKSQIDELKPVLINHRGSCPLYIVLKDTRKVFMASRDMWVNIDQKLIDELSVKLGDENIKVS
jgi:DNA polymerase-3 subunit alpha